MKYRDLVKLLTELGCQEVRQVGSHVRWRCGQCLTTLVAHGAGALVAAGTLRNIERDLRPCLGKGWLQ